jgi:hypothetical protein
LESAQQKWFCNASATHCPISAEWIWQYLVLQLGGQ